MTDTDRPEFIERMIALADLFGRKLSVGAAELSFRALKDLPSDEVFPAMDTTAVHGEFFPRPTDIRDHVRQERIQRRLSDSTREALSEGPGEPIALPAGHGPRTMAPAKPVERIKLAGTDATPQAVAIATERQRRAGETWDQSMARLRRQREALGLTDADVAAAKQEAS